MKTPDYPEGALGNWGEWTLQNTAQVAAPGLTYSDGTHSLQVSGNTMVAPIDWDPFENIPIKLDGRIPNSTIPHHTNGFRVLRLTQSDTSTTYDLFLNPPLTALPETPTGTGTTDGTFTFNGVGVNTGGRGGELLPAGRSLVPAGCQVPVPTAGRIIRLANCSAQAAWSTP